VPSLPWDFVVLGVPASVQAKPSTKQRWKTKVAASALSAWPAGEGPLTDKVQIHITFYHESAPLDVDNMLKPIQDALFGAGPRVCCNSFARGDDVSGEPFHPQRAECRPPGPMAAARGS
jgi:hypothetical protein